METNGCEKNCSAREAVICDLRDRPEPRRIDLEKLYECNSEELIGYFADDSHYDTLVQEDCDVYVGGVKVLAFRKRLFSDLKGGAKGSPEAWKYFRDAGKWAFSDQRGLVAGREFTTLLDLRPSNGMLNFFKKAKKGQVSSVEEALKILEMSPDLSKYAMRVGEITKDFPEIAEQLKPIDSELRKKATPTARKEELKRQRGEVMRGWFPLWLERAWKGAEDQVAEAKRADSTYISNQIRANFCHSNVVGALDRGARNPYGRLTGTTERNLDGFVKHKNVYHTACAGLKETLNTPENPRWDVLSKRFLNVKDERYNLFGTVFTSLTVNWNFRCAMHRDAHNCDGGIAVLSAITQGEYEGHYLVFPELRCAFDLRDGDFLAGDNQSLIHGNTAMIPKTPDAERVSLVFYSRERAVNLDSWECEKCRKDFLDYAVENLQHRGTGRSSWAGVWEGQWTSQEWYDYRESRGMLHCSNSNYWATRPFRNTETGKVEFSISSPGESWELVEVWETPKKSRR